MLRTCSAAQPTLFGARDASKLYDSLLSKRLSWKRQFALYKRGRFHTSSSMALVTVKGTSILTLCDCSSRIWGESSDQMRVPGKAVCSLHWCWKQAYQAMNSEQQRSKSGRSSSRMPRWNTGRVLRWQQRKPVSRQEVKLQCQVCGRKITEGNNSCFS